MPTSVIESKNAVLVPRTLFKSVACVSLASKAALSRDRVVHESFQAALSCNRAVHESVKAALSRVLLAN